MTAAVAPIRSASIRAEAARCISWYRIASLTPCGSPSFSYRNAKRFSLPSEAPVRQVPIVVREALAGFAFDGDRKKAASAPKRGPHITLRSTRSSGQVHSMLWERSYHLAIAQYIVLVEKRRQTRVKSARLSCSKFREDGGLER